MNATETDSLVGTVVLGRYRMMHELAHGGMGAVFLGRTEGAEGFARPVVIKRVLPALMQDASVAEMFVREASILSHLQHPNIVAVLDFGQDDDGAYVMVLEYVHGFQLGHWLHYVTETREQLDPDLALQVIIKVLEALHYAHTFKHGDGKALQIVHRDVSPSNVMLSQQGVVKLLDFGVARVSGRGRATDSGGLQGKLPYLPPEAFRGEDPTVQGDVYACGVLLYELLAGFNPFAADTAAELRKKVIANKPPSLHALRDDLHEEIESVLQRAIHRVAAARFESAAEFAQALRAMRSRPEDVIGDRLTEALSRDFGPELAAMVGALPLEKREKAWRGTGPLSVRPRPADGEAPHEEPTVRADADSELMEALRPSDHPTVPPPAGADGAEPIDITDLPGDQEQERPTVELSTLPAATPDTVPAPEPLGPTGPPGPPPPAPPPLAPPPLPTAAEPGARSPMRWVWPAIALIAIGAAVAMGLQSDPPPPPPSDEFVVIEREKVAPEPAPAKPAPTAAEPAPEAAGAKTAKEAQPPAQDESAEEPAPAAADKPKERKNSTPRQLTVYLKRRRAQFERCFETHTKELAGKPRLELRFQLEPSGKIQAVQLFPEALTGTDLGGCLLEVARGTRFPKQKELMAFRIPITAITTRGKGD